MSFEFNLSTETVAAIQPQEALSVSPEATIRQVFALFKKHNTGSVMVCRDGKLQGIFTERDALPLMAEGADLDIPIEQVMVANPVTIPSTATVGEAIRRMSDGGYRRLPIVDVDSQPVGFIKVSGVVHYLVEHVPDVVYNLPPEPRKITHEREGA